MVNRINETRFVAHTVVRGQMHLLIPSWHPSGAIPILATSAEVISMPKGGGSMMCRMQHARLIKLNKRIAYHQWMVVVRVGFFFFDLIFLAIGSNVGGGDFSATVDDDDVIVVEVLRKVMD